MPVAAPGPVSGTLPPIAISLSAALARPATSVPATPASSAVALRLLIIMAFPLAVVLKLFFETVHDARSHCQGRAVHISRPSPATPAHLRRVLYAPLGWLSRSMLFVRPLRNS